MKKLFTFWLLLLMSTASFAQWSPTDYGREGKSNASKDVYFKLNLNELRTQLAAAQEMGRNSRPVVVSIPTLNGKIENFNVYSFPVLVKELADQYQLGSYTGVSVKDPSVTVRFSVAPNDFQCMMFVDGAYQFIDPVDKNLGIYRVHPKSKPSGGKAFVCTTQEDPAYKAQMQRLYDRGNSFANNPADFSKNSDKKYRTMRLAMSVTGEYTQYFGGTVAAATTAINATMTRVNGVYERDFALHLNVQNFPQLIYTNAATDPYSPSAQMNNWNLELQQNLTNTIGNAAYDIGHLFGASGGGGNAGCIGCVCINPTGPTNQQKGSGYTSPADGIPQGDNFDIDYVAHEMGHQLGGNHTFSHGLEGAGVNVEPGSGSTIMGYAGITGPNTDVQPHSDAYFHTVTIGQVQTNLNNKTCDVETPITNNPPVIAALPTYNIPKGTAFVLTGSATDAENDPMTYVWEERDNATVTINKNNLGNTASGASFRSIAPSTNPTRYFPRLSSVLAGVLNNTNNLWEAVSTVARTQNFAFTVRDNNPAANQKQTSTATQQIIVGNDGPFVVTTTSVNNNVPTAVTWNVVNTNNAPYNVANVKVDFTTDNGATWTVVSASTPNDGSENLIFTGLTNGQNIKLRISAIGNVFYAVSSATVVAAPMVANLPYIQPFDTNDFTFSNGTQTNKWVWGSAAGNPANAIYISNDNGATNSYSLTNTSVVHAYNDFNIPAGTTVATFGFDWKNAGQTTVDFMKVWLVPSTFTPTPGVLITAGAGRLQVGALYNQQSSWQNYFNINQDISSFAGQTMRLVFEWRNDNSGGTQPPAAVDNVILVVPTCQVPTALAFNTVTSSTANISWTAANPVPAIGYEYFVSTSPNPPTAATVPTGTTATTTAALTGLLPNTTYYFWVRSRCSATDTSLWMVGPSFQTLQVPANLPYTQQFTGPNDFTLVNGTQVNKWYYGNVVGNTGNSLYISNDNGVTHAYSTSPTVTTYAYRDLAIPAGATVANVLFDWIGNGEGTWDYLKVWAVPANYFPTAGQGAITAGAGRVQVGGTFNQKTSWQNYFNPTFNVSSFAGQTMRLVFEWRNDGSGGNQPPAAIDNVQVVIPNCQVPTNIVVSNIAANTATLTWTAANPVPANGYEYFVSTSPNPPTAATVPTGASATTTTNVTGLLPNTTYYVWVRSKCSATSTSLWYPGPSFVTGQIPANLPYIQPFNGNTNDFTFVNGTQTNKWYFGNVVGNPGNSLYISNDNGVTHAYNISSSSVVQAYRDIAIPAGATNANFLFDWLAMGESSFDYIRVWLVPTSFVPTPGTQIGTGGGRIQVAGNFNQKSTWQNYFNPTLNVSSFAGQTMRLVFEWRNDGSGGTQPPGAIDNIQLVIPTCQVPTNITVTNVGATTATINWTAANPAPVGGYQYYVSTNNTPPTAATTPTGATTATTANLTGLLPNTTYYVWVRSKCVGTDTSLWMPGPSFMTGQIPATFPYVQQFTGPNANDFSLSNGNQTNKWVVGTATGNPANSLYVTNDNGVTNAYTTNAASVVHAYRDIAIPAGTTDVIFEYDWKNVGENGWDYIRVWLVPVSFNPVPGTQITTAPGRIQVNGNHQGQNTWQQFSNQNFDLSSFAGQTMRLVFEWRNDGVGGAQPPGAIDNIRLVKCSNLPPANYTITGITSTTATANWTADLGGATYIFKYRPVGSTTWITVPLAAGTNTYLMQNLQPFTQYETELQAVCNNTAGTPATANFTTPCSTAAPLNLTVTNVTFTTADLNWGASAGVTYSVRYREVGNAVWTTFTTTTNSTQLTGLTPGKTYEVQVANICNNTTGAYSSSQVFTCPTTCDMAPTGLTITQITNTSALANWNAFPGATYIVRIRKVGAMMWNTLNSAVNTYTFTGLSENTQYEVQVANVCNGTPGNFSPLYLFTTSTIVYCDQTSHNSASEHISNVTVTNSKGVKMTNDSGPSNYTSYVPVSDALVRLYKGSSNNQISIEKKWASTTYDEAVVVWIDFNRNGMFEASEMIVNSPANQVSPITATFNVPSNAYVSITDDKFILMRVAMRRDAAPVACLDFDNGEIEDYKVLIIEPPLNNALDPNSIQIYPNPVKNILFVTKVKDGAKYKVYDAAGRVAKTGTILANKIDMTSLISGVYVIDIDNNGETAQKKFIKE
ncbi:MAG: fibronectin type III domain-containing protein [Bacteroidetes bacterium]|nr:fibronectin type III domain-containing protein [Bacteroidota bacterium]